jgi:hypothetical protein
MAGELKIEVSKRTSECASSKLTSEQASEQAHKLTSEQASKRSNMKVKDIIKALKKCNQNNNIIFYYLKNNDLINCGYETLLSVDNRVELTIQDLNNTTKE